MSQKPARSRSLIAPLLGIAIVVTLWMALGLDLRHLDVPINNSGDTLWFAVLVKGLVDNGWLYEIPQLGAPYSLNAVLFPAISNFDWGVMKLLSFAFHDAGTVLNSFFLISLAATGMSAYASLRLLRIEYWLAVPAAFLYALLPFAFERNLAHICLTYFCVPPICMLCLRLLDRNDHEPLRRSIAFAAAACVVQGFNYIYFSFFSAILLIFVVAAVVLLRLPSSRWKPAVLCLSLLLTATALNLVPSVLAWRHEGKPQSLDYKSPAESEIYGLKIRRLVVPHVDNVIPGLHYWAVRDAEANFPNENENRAARLGLFGSIAFLLALVLAARRLLSPGRDSTGWQNGCLVLVGLCLAIGTVGGLGSVFNVLTVSDIRGYNRISVFIAFLVFAFLCGWMTKEFQAQRTTRKRLIIAAPMICLILLSVYDQLLEATPLREGRVSDAEVSANYADLVKRLEDEFDGKGRVYMLPFMPFPTDPGVGRVPAYEHARAYLASKRFSWSWPVLSNKQKLWANRIETTSGAAFVRALIYSGFDLVWVNRDGYGDSAKAVEGTLMAAGATAVRTESFEPIHIYDLRQVALDVRAKEGADLFARHQSEWDRPVAIVWKSGFYASEVGSQGLLFRWSRKSSKFEVHNAGSSSADVTVQALVQASASGDLTVKTATNTQHLAISSTPTLLELHLAVPPAGTTEVDLEAAVERVVAPNDAREMYFNLQNMRIDVQ